MFLFCIRFCQVIFYVLCISIGVIPLGAVSYRFIFILCVSINVAYCIFCFLCYFNLNVVLCVCQFVLIIVFVILCSVE